jgi:predicted transcriptional regulator
LAKQTNIVIEKANRLIDLCRKRSLKHNDKTQVWLSHVCIDCDLDESFIPSCATEVDGGMCTILPTFTNKQGRICKRKLIVEGNDVFASFQKCLKDYSKLIKKETLYDKFIKLNDSYEWLRGLFLLADSCSDARKVYHDMPPIFKDAPYRQASATYTFKEMEELECTLDEFSSGKVENGVSYQDVSKLWQADPGARWVLHWVDIFEAIEMSTQSLTDSFQEKEVGCDSANNAAQLPSFTEKERNIFQAMREQNPMDFSTNETIRVNSGHGAKLVKKVIDELIRRGWAERHGMRGGVRLTTKGRTAYNQAQKINIHNDH